MEELHFGVIENEGFLERLYSVVENRRGILNGLLGEDVHSERISEVEQEEIFSIIKKP